MDFAECPQCHCYHKDTSCKCDTANRAVRIQGEWNLYKIEKTDRFSKFHFKQGNERLAHVQFHSDGSQVTPYEEGQIYKLIGWQRCESRHNILTINGA